MTSPPTDSADRKEQAERQPLRGPDLARATLAAIRATNNPGASSATDASEIGDDARARARNPGPMPASEQDSEAVTSGNVAPADSQSAGADAKAAQLLAAGRVRVREAMQDRALVVVLGNSGRHVVRRDPTGWSCTCEAAQYRRRCSHVLAARLVLEESA